MKNQIVKIMRKKLSQKDYKLNPIIQEITHMNQTNFFIFLNIQIKNLFSMDLEELFEFDRLLYKQGIIKKFDEEKKRLNKKEMKYAFNLLKDNKNNYIKGD